MSVFLLTTTCGTCGTPLVQTQPPDICDLQIVGVNRAIVGFLNCEVTAPALPNPPTLPALQALVAANTLSFIGVYNFNEAADTFENATIDGFVDTPVSTTKTFTWSHAFRDLTVAKTDEAYWNEKLRNRAKLHLVTIFQGDTANGDIVRFWRTSMHNFTQSEAYDTTARTNLYARDFSVTLNYSNKDVQLSPRYMVAGAYAAFGSWA